MLTKPRVTVRSTSKSHNPFATRFVRPGAVDFLFPPTVNSSALWEQFAGLDRRAQICGPHGSGKSTLLQTLIRGWRQLGEQPALITLHDRQKTLPADWDRDPAVTVVMVDGYEQLNSWNRRRLLRHTRKYHQGLLVTTHHDCGLPTLFRTEVRAHLAETVVSRLLGQEVASPSRNDLSRLLDHHQGNFREVLFELYDWYEGREPS